MDFGNKVVSGNVEATVHGQSLTRLASHRNECPLSPQNSARNIMRKPLALELLAFMLNHNGVLRPYVYAKRFRTTN